METKFKGNFGELTLSIIETTATGWYQDSGKLTGEFINNTFKGQWENKGLVGLIEFTTNNGKLEGKWKKGLDPGPMKGKWEGFQISDVSMESKNQSELKESFLEKEAISDSINRFINYWEERIINWSHSHHEIVHNGIESHFYLGKQNKKLVSDAFPEPYLGDPYSCSCVIINLNPGGVLHEEQNLESGTFVVEWRKSKSYLSIAKQFIYLKPELKSGFWIDRQKWIVRLLENNHIKSSRRPFALEIIPFHSKSFGSLVYNDEFRNYIMKHLLPTAEEALSYSDLKFIITVGKSFYDSFNWLGFKKVIEWNHENHPKNIEWPKNKNNKALQRSFSIWESPNGKYYYNTWHKGGNKMPSKEWKEIEFSLHNELIKN